ncbi:MAG: tRNA guanosine(34) transglycosylase Tgt, partial [Oligoflexia bacterium]|nr:tRNA guanosine(34) transglycosylase Tgt [Oligoflexia bacterium]
MPVGTKGTVKAVPPDMLHKLEVSVILGNTYHLFLRPGHKLITEFGGLHDFMGWNRPILTDSGGYQVFSLARLRKITEEGVCFRSHIDGSKHLITPEISMQVQDALSADIRMVFDECPPCDADYSYVRKSLELTARWAVRSKKEWERLGKGGSLFGIIQGGMHSRLRKESLDRLLDTGFDGYAIGGLSVGEPKPDMYRILNDLSSHLPSGKPVYLMGVGEPEDILFAVKNGVHMFDCVIPTRNARNGTLYTFNGRISIKRSCFFSDKKPVEETCDCYTCRNFS